MGLGPGDIQVEPWNVRKSRGENMKDCAYGEPGCWSKVRFMGSCLYPRTKREDSINGTCTQYADSKSTNVSNESTNESNGTKNESNGTSTGQQVVPVVSSSTTTNTESTSCTLNISEELKVASQLRKFSFNDLKSATRCFRPESLLGEGGFGCVFKGWISENGTAPVKPGTGLSVKVKNA